jgi:hypothetical protein
MSRGGLRRAGTVAAIAGYSTGWIQNVAQGATCRSYGQNIYRISEAIGPRRPVRRLRAVLNPDRFRGSGPCRAAP